MADVTILTTCPFEDGMLGVTMDTLRNQTCQDFVWLFLDGFYSRNKQAIQEFADSVKFSVTHVPLLHDPSTPHKFHWEPYNSALLLCDTPYFLRFGVFRSFHPQAIADAVGYMRDGSCVDFFQECVQAPVAIFGNDPVWEMHDHPFSTCGMFGMDVETTIYELNGNDEVGLHQHHHEDGELTSRMEQLKRKCMLSKAGLFRYEHDKNPEHMYAMEVPTKRPCESPGCPRNAPRLAPERGETIRRYNHCRHFSYRGMSFWRCENCGAFSPEDAVEFRDWPRANREKRSAVGVDGHGRNLGMWRDRLRGLKSLQSRVEMIADSYGRRDD